MTTDTPIFKATLEDTGIDIQAILDRPRWEPPAHDADAAWERIAGEQKTLAVSSTAKRTRQRQRRSSS